VSALDVLANFSGKMVILKFSKAVIPKPRTFTGEARACLGRSRGESRVYAFKLAVGLSTPAQVIPDRERRRPDVQHRRKPFQLMVPRPVQGLTNAVAGLYHGITVYSLNSSSRSRPTPNSRPAS